MTAPPASKSRHPGGSFSLGLDAQPIMNARPILVLAALVAATGNACAQRAGSAPLTREDVVQQVLEARTNGALRHAGEAGPRGDDAYKVQVEAAPTLTRTQQSTLVLQARRARALAHAGSAAPEEQVASARATPSTSTRTRAEVKQHVLEALADGTLTPARVGEHPDVRPADR